MRKITSRVYLIFASVVILVINLGYADPKPKTEIPSYTIIKDDNLAHYKRSVYIQLSRKVSEEALRSIALEVKNLDHRQYDRTFISYFLPGRDVEDGKWATSHFDPDLTIKIRGLSIEEEAFLRSDVIDSTWEVIGGWFDEEFGKKLTIYKQDDMLYMERKFPDGSAFSFELIEKPSPRGRMFERVSDDNFGEYYLIDQQGHLQFWGRNGHFATAWKID